MMPAAAAAGEEEECYQQELSPFTLLKQQQRQQQRRTTTMNNNKKKKKVPPPAAGGGPPPNEDDVTISDHDVVDAFASFNQDIALRDHCVNRVFTSNGLRKACNCLQILLHHQQEKQQDEDHSEEDVEAVEEDHNQQSRPPTRGGGLLLGGPPPPFCSAVAEYQTYFCSLKREEQQKIAIEWMRTSEAVRLNAPKNSPLYTIPFLLPPPKGGDGEDKAGNDGQPFASSLFKPLSETLICRDALMDLLGVGRRWWLAVINHCNNHTLPNHKLKGKPPNAKRKWDEMYADDLIQHFEELRKEAGPIATRFVREHTGEIAERDANEDAEYLAPCWSKRQCYYNFCASRGVKVVSNSRGARIMSRIEPEEEEEDAGNNSSNSSSDDDEFFDAGNDHPKVPSWGAYLSFWNKEYPNLKVSRPAEDICGYCYKFYNCFRFIRRTRGRGGVVVGATNRNDSSPPSCLSFQTGSILEDEPDSTIPLDNQGRPTDDSEAEILKAAEHIQMADAQRRLVNEKMKQAMNDASHGVPHSRRTYTFIVDYGQNMELPFFGQSQPGDTYHFTPLAIYNLGVVDASNQDHLYCHIYREGAGKKGGNNVASLLLKTLFRLKVLQQPLRIFG
jgi:hypothetical protein